MSFYSLNGISFKFCRQAFILAQRQNVRHPCLSPVNSPFVRRTHDGLYQMVKKRTLEARTKMNQQPNSPNQFSNTNQASSANSSQAPSTLNTASPSKSPIPPFSKGVKTSTQKDPDRGTPNNVKVLGATGCHSSKDNRVTPGSPCDKTRTAPPGCGEFQAQQPPCIPPDSKGGKGGGGRGNDCDKPPNSKLPKALLLLLAALGAGGLLFWLKSGSKKEEVLKDDNLPCKEPENKTVTPPVPSTSNLPTHVPYLLIGGGTASFSAFRAIKSNDPTAKVLMITNECRKPYMRPPLSKELWYSARNGETTPDYRFKQWTGAERSLFFEPEEFFIDPSKLMDNPHGGIAVAHGLTAKRIDPVNHKVTLSDGSEISYDNCLIATGCTPKKLPVFQNASPGVRERVMVYRTPEDFERLKRYADQKKSIMIVGNGFIGSELACSLATYAKCKGGKIYQVFSESGNMSRVLPDYLSKWTTRKVQDQGVCVIPNASIRAAQRDESSLKITLNNGNTLLTDVVVVCVGCDPNTSLAYSSGLEVHPELGGFVVNAELEARQNLYVAGDASCFYDPLLGRRRVEHHDHSVVSGRLAGENMVGKKKPYTHQSMFWSDLGPEIGYEAIGLIDASLPTVGIFALSPRIDRPSNSDNLTENRTQSEVISPKDCVNQAVATCDDPEDVYGKGVIFYLRNGKVVGILLWNLFNRIGLARTVINQDKKFEDLNEVAKLFEIHS